MNYSVNERGYYGEFGGAFIPEMMVPNIDELRENYLKILNDPAFRQEFTSLLKDYVGRPSPLYYAKRLSEFHNTRVYLKREDLNHRFSLPSGWAKPVLLPKPAQDSMVWQRPPCAR